MSKKKYDVVAVTGEYTNAQGEVKKRYLNCGVVIQTDKGFSLKMEAMPIGGDGWFMLFEPKPKQAPQDPPPQPAPQGGDFDNSFNDDVPF